MNKSTALWLVAMCCPARCRLKHWNACRISTVPVQLIYGNGEVAVLEQLAGRDPAAVPEPYRLTIRWTAEQLGPEQQRFLAAWPKTRCRNLPGLGQVLYCHATPRNENECFTRLTPESRLCRFSRDWAYAWSSAAIPPCSPPGICAGCES